MKETFLIEDATCTMIDRYSVFLIKKISLLISQPRLPFLL